MLKEILSISGKPGLYKLLSQGKNMFIVETIGTGKKMPVYARDQVISLEDIYMYTETDEVPLRQVLSKMKEIENGELASIKPKSKPAELNAYFATILEDFDRDRVYSSDIKKLIQWYNLLTENKLNDFSAEETETEKEAE